MNQEASDLSPEVTSTFMTQLGWLASREMDGLLRDKAALIGRFGITIFLNLLFGLIFRDAGAKDDSNEGYFYDHFGGEEWRDRVERNAV